MVLLTQLDFIHKLNNRNETLLRLWIHLHDTPSYESEQNWRFVSNASFTISISLSVFDLLIEINESINNVDSVHRTLNLHVVVVVVWNIERLMYSRTEMEEKLKNFSTEFIIKNENKRHCLIQRLLFAWSEKS